MRTPSSALILTAFCLNTALYVNASVSADENTAANANASTAAPAPLTFEKDIRPILRAHCMDCHGATEEVQGNLDLRQVRLMLKGGESGPALTPGAAKDSLILQRIAAGEMPPGDSHISEKEQETLAEWIRQGAHTARPEPESIPVGLGLTPEERSFWSFQPIQVPSVPSIAEPRASRVRTPIDSFLLHAMPDGLSFAADADRSTLIRRLAMVLTGLPMSAADVQRWQSDPGSDWYERLVEELLASEHYGERWGRHWLDVAGYADSDGYTVADQERPWAWKYRDYVIRSFNQDKPFDRFVAEQLAGDELAGPIQGDLTSEQTDLLAATGFLRMAADGTGSGANDDTGRNQVISDTLRIVSTSLLGLSVACAQCHDHRYDPILQSDYYALRAVFAPAMDWQQWKTPEERRISLYTALERQQAAEIDAEAGKISEERSKKQAEYMAQALEQELTKHPESLRDSLRTAYQTAADKRSPEQKALLDKYPSVNISPGVLYQYLPKAAEDLKTYDSRINEVRQRKPKEEFLSILTEPVGHLPETRLFHRGDFQQPKQVVAPAALSAASPEDSPVQFPLDDPSLPTSGRRLALARWLTSRQNPLTARVIVNRIWLHHFGRGIVGTPADFGKLGARPTHPELLDWLADQFIEQGYSIKQMHRLILSSTAWRQSTQRTPAHDELDPDNRFYSRRPVMRLDAEVVRDQMLAVSGKLDEKLFGPPVPIKEDDAGQVIVDASQTRRSLYVKARRSQPVAMLQAFDSPVMETNCEIRPVSTVATQSLMLMNSQSVLELAAALAERCQKEPADVSAELLNGLPELPQPAASSWQFGYGMYDEQAARTGNFYPFAHWSGSAWQPGAAVPDPVAGYAFLTADGGHPDAVERSVIRRWTAPFDGVAVISGTLSHSTGNGDGVRGRIVSSRSGLAGSWNALNSNASTDVASVVVQKGDTIDFITDCLTSITSDSFTWPVQVSLTPDTGEQRTYASKDGFHGPLEKPEAVPGQVMRAWQLTYGRNPETEEFQQAVHFVNTQIAAISDHAIPLPAGRNAWQEAMTTLCHALITSNEFLYAD